MRARAQALGVALLVAAVAGCSYNGAGDLPLPGAVGSDGYPVTIVLTDATNLVPKETCRTNDTVVGTVESVRLNGQLQAKVVCRIKKDVSVPANVVATLRETSLLGERYVALDVPDGATAIGELAHGTTIPASLTVVHPDTEVVLGALSQVLNGGSLGSIATISREVNQALDGRTDDARSTVARLDDLLGTLESNRGSVIAALDSLDRFSGTLADQRQVIGQALDEVPQGLAVLDRQRPQLVRMLQRLDRLGTVAVRLIRRSKANTVADLQHLQPVLTDLNKTGNELAASLERITSFPFSRNSLHTIKGDYAGMYGQASLDIDAINKLLGSFATGQSSSGPLPKALTQAQLSKLLELGDLGGSVPGVLQPPATDLSGLIQGP